jgi:hypothetical protein
MKSLVSKYARVLQNSSCGRFIISDDAKKCQLAGAQLEMGQAPRALIAMPLRHSPPTWSCESRAENFPRSRKEQVQDDSV